MLSGAGTILFTVAGFITAVLANQLVPQYAEDVKINEHTIGNLAVDMNAAYRFIVIVIAAIYLIVGAAAVSDKERRRKYQKRAPFRFAMGIALAVWDILGTKLQILPQPFFPGPAGIVEAFLAEGGYILQNTLYSLRLFIVGFTLGVLFGVTTGVLIGWFPKVYYWVAPVLNITGVIPAVAWMPFALTLFPTPFVAAAFLIVICAWFPVASLTASGVQSTPKTQFEAARTLGGKTSYLVFHVAIPHALPQIFTGINTATAFAFTTLVMAEMMGQPGGLGYYINASKVWSAYYKVFAAIIVMAVLFSLITKVVGLIEKRVLRWQRGLVK
ncbi:MAG: ABC transporter permease [Huintestinicola sp.]